MLPPTFVPGFHDEQLVQKMRYTEFGKTGLKVSRLSLGTGGFSDLYGDFSLEKCKQTVYNALKSGVNYIDTAPWYGQGVSEATLGKCLKGIPRESYYLATKVGRYEKDPKKMFDFSAEATRKSIEKSLRVLGHDYIDVIQIHDIEFAPSVDYVIEETLPVLREAVKGGKARFIGVTGYPVSKLAEFKRKAPEIDMILSYSRFNLFDQELLNFREDFKDVGVVNAAVLGMGLLTSQGPQPWHPAGELIKSACRKAADLCQSKNIDLAKLALHYAFRDDSISHTVLSGMNTPEILEVTLKALHEELNDAELSVFRKLQSEIFGKLSVRNWEGVELANYRKALME